MLIFCVSMVLDLCPRKLILNAALTVLELHLRKLILNILLPVQYTSSTSFDMQLQQTPFLLTRSYVCLINTHWMLIYTRQPQK